MRVGPGAGDWRADLAVSRATHHYLGEIKSVPRGSGAPLEDHWSRAVLQIRYAAQLAPKALGRQLAVIVAPKVSVSAVDRLAAFAQRYTPDVALGVMDKAGLQEFRDPGFDSLRAEPKVGRLPVAKHAASAMNLLSDLNQWLLKVLLAPDLPERFLSASCALHVASNGTHRRWLRQRAAP